MKYEGILGFTQFATHSVAYADCDGCCLRASSEIRIQLVNGMRGERLENPATNLEKKKLTAVQTSCDSSGLYVPPAMGDGDDNIRSK